jgi:hypothetical protein
VLTDRMEEASEKRDDDAVKLLFDSPAASRAV